MKEPSFWRQVWWYVLHGPRGWGKEPWAKIKTVGEFGSNKLAADPDWVKELIEKYRKKGPFKPGAWYNRLGDIIEVWFEEDESYSEWLNHNITLMLSVHDKRIIGFQIWGVKRLLEQSQEPCETITIPEMLEKAKDKSFKPCVYYDPDGDCIEFLLSNEPFNGHWINYQVTIYHDRDTKQIIGGNVFGIKSIMEAAANE